MTENIQEYPVFSNLYVFGKLHFFYTTFSLWEQVGGLEHQCIRWQIMRKNARKQLEEDGGDYRYSEGSFNAHAQRTDRREREGGGEKREKDRIRLMSFAQTRREANVIYEDRATSRVGEVSQLKNLWNDVETSRNGAFSMRSGASKTRIQFPRGNFAVLWPRDFDRSLHGSTEREPSKCGWSKAELAAF